MAARDYIVCSRRKSRPRVQIEVCHRCRFRKGCRELISYIQPSLFPLSRERSTGRGDRT